ncbi:hypothetical protein [Campylobacter avium]|uniref:hypothetical protein n=1 Tax=Campylobacter avium TaxID=522485 RepID=UPI002356CE9D|nr:hypothetical protein [Campylobacter avium]
MKDFLMQKLKRQEQIFKKLSLQDGLYKESNLILKRTREDIKALKESIYKRANENFKKEARLLIKKALKDINNLCKEDEQRYESFKKYEKDFVKHLNTNLI